MTPPHRLDDLLGVEALRAGFLRYTRQAFALLPPRERPRLLDLGCGEGLPTIELARLGGALVMHETLAWFKRTEALLGEVGFVLTERLLLPSRCWWTDYYAPLEAGIRALRAAGNETLDPERLAQLEREIALVKPDAEQYDCGFFVLQKSGRPPGLGPW